MSTPDTQTLTPCALYRHFDRDGRLLYVGISRDPEKRWAQHRTQSWWVMANRVGRVSIEWFADERQARTAERAAIRLENPAHNRLRPKRAATAPTLRQLIARHRREEAAR